MKKGLTNSLGWLILETQKSRACVELRQISTVLTSLIITMLLCFPVWCHKPYSSLLPNKPQRFFRVCQWCNSLKGVCTFLSFPLRFHSFRLRENASGWSAPKVDSPVLNWRTDPWHQPWCTLHVWISCPSNSTNEFGRNLGDAQIGDMEGSTLPLLFTSKKAPSPWNFHGEGHLSAPDLGLASSNLPCDWRIIARTFRMISVLGWLAPSCASWPASALRCSSSAWRLEVAPLRHYKLAT